MPSFDLLWMSHMSVRHWNDWNTKWCFYFGFTRWVGFFLMSPSFQWPNSICVRFCGTNRLWDHSEGMICNMKEKTLDQTGILGARPDHWQWILPASGSIYLLIFPLVELSVWKKEEFETQQIKSLFLKASFIQSPWIGTEISRTVC